MSFKSEEISIEVLKNVTEILFKHLLLSQNELGTNSNMIAFIFGEIISFRKQENNDLHYQLKTQYKRIILNSVKFDNKIDNMNNEEKNEKLVAMAFFENSIQNQDKYTFYKKSFNDLIMLNVEYSLSMTTNIPTNKILFNFYNEIDESFYPITNVNFINFKETVYAVNGLTFNTYEIKNEEDNMTKTIEKDLVEKRKKILKSIDKEYSKELYENKVEFNKNLKELRDLLDQL